MRPGHGATVGVGQRDSSVKEGGARVRGTVVTHGPAATPAVVPSDPRRENPVANAAFERVGPGTVIEPRPGPMAGRDYGVNYVIDYIDLLHVKTMDVDFTVMIIAVLWPS